MLSGMMDEEGAEQGWKVRRSLRSPQSSNLELRVAMLFELGLKLELKWVRLESVAGAKTREPPHVNDYGLEKEDKFWALDQSQYALLWSCASLLRRDCLGFIVFVLLIDATMIVRIPVQTAKPIFKDSGTVNYR